MPFHAWQINWLFWLTTYLNSVNRVWYDDADCKHLFDMFMFHLLLFSTQIWPWVETQLDCLLVDGNNPLELNGCASLNTHTHHEFSYRIHAFHGKGANLSVELSLRSPLIIQLFLCDYCLCFLLNIAYKLTKCDFAITTICAFLTQLDLAFINCLLTTWHVVFVYSSVSPFFKSN